MIRAQILFPQEMYEQIKYEAKRKKTSISAVVRKSVKTTIGKKSKNGGMILRDMAKGLAFSDPNIPSDLSTNDEYIYGKKH